MQYCEGNYSLPAGAAIPLYSIVKIDSSGNLVVCAAADANAIGTTLREAFAAAEVVPVRPLHANGSHIMIASGAIAVGDVCNQAASGKIQTGAGTVKRGYAKTAATADGEYVEVLPAL